MFKVIPFPMIRFLCSYLYSHPYSVLTLIHPSLSLCIASVFISFPLSNSMGEVEGKVRCCQKQECELGISPELELYSTRVRVQRRVTDFGANKLKELNVQRKKK